MPETFINVCNYNGSLLLSEVMTNNDWDVFTSRQKSIECQRETKNVPLRNYVPIENLRNIDNCAVMDTTLLKHYPRTVEFLKELPMTWINIPGFVMRASWVMIPPGNRVYEHIDHGYYYKSTSRFHLVVQGEYRMFVRAPSGDVVEQVMKANELWWFNNDLPHWVDNIGQQDRIALIFDVAHSNYQGYKA